MSEEYELNTAPIKSTAPLHLYGADDNPESDPPRFNGTAVRAMVEAAGGVTPAQVSAVSESVVAGDAAEAAARASAVSTLTAADAAEVTARAAADAALQTQVNALAAAIPGAGVPGSGVPEVAANLGVFAGGAQVFFNKVDFDQCPNPGKVLASQATLAALGIHNPQTSTSLPATVWRRDGTFGFADHNLIAYSENFGMWVGGVRKTPIAGTKRWSLAKTTTSTSEAAGAPITLIQHASAPKLSARIKVRAGTSDTLMFGIYNGTDVLWQMADGFRILSGPGAAWVGYGPQGGLITLYGLSTTEDTEVALIGSAIPAGKSVFLYIYPGGAGSTTIGHSIEIEYACMAWCTGVPEYVPNHGAGIVFGPTLEYNRGAVSQFLAWSSDLTNALWTKLGTVTAGAPEVRSNGVRMSLVQNIGGLTTDAIYQVSASLTMPENSRFELGLWLEKVSPTGTLEVFHPTGTAYGRWSIDLGDLPAGPVWVTREHPAVTVVADFKASAASACAVAFGQIVNGTTKVSVYIAALMDRGTRAPAAYLEAGSNSSGLHTVGTPTRQNLFPNSADLSSWTTVRASKTGSSAITVVEDTSAANTHYAQSAVNLVPITPGAIYTARVAIKKGAGNRNAAIWVYGATGSVMVIMEPVNGTFLSHTISGGSVMVSISSIPLDDGWQAILIRTRNVDSALAILVGMADGINPVYTGDGVSSMMFKGPQISEGRLRTDAYVETTLKTGTISEYPVQDLLCSPQVTNLALSSTDLSTVLWTKRGTCTATLAGDSVIGPYSQIRGLGASGVNDLSQSFNYGIGNNAAYEPAFMLRKVSDSGTVSFAHPSATANGSWLVDLAKVRPGWQRIDRWHPAVAIANEYTTTAAGIGGAFFAALSGTLDFDIALINSQSGRLCGPLIPTESASRLLHGIWNRWPGMPFNNDAHTVVVRCEIDSIATAYDILARSGAGAGIMLYHNTGQNVLYTWDQTNSLPNPAPVISGQHVGTFAISRSGILMTFMRDRMAPGTVPGHTAWTGVNPTGLWSIGTNFTGSIRAIRIGQRAAERTDLQAIANHLI